MQSARDLARDDGIFVGISAGANVFAARQVAAQLSPEQNVVTILCDTGERYLTTNIFD
jgi:cysteine synthase A